MSFTFILNSALTSCELNFNSSTRKCSITYTIYTSNCCQSHAQTICSNASNSVECWNSCTLLLISNNISNLEVSKVIACGGGCTSVRDSKGVGNTEVDGYSKI